MTIFIDWENRRVFSEDEIDHEMEISGETPCDFGEWVNENYNPSDIYEMFDRDPEDAETTLREGYEEYAREARENFLYYCGKYDIHPAKGIREIL